MICAFELPPVSTIRILVPQDHTHISPTAPKTAVSSASVVEKARFPQKTFLQPTSAAAGAGAEGRTLNPTSSVSVTVSWADIIESSSTNGSGFFFFDRSARGAPPPAQLHPSAVSTCAAAACRVRTSK